MRKILIVFITTLGLVVGMGSTIGPSEAAKKPSTFKVKAEASSHNIISGQTLLFTGSVKPKQSAIGRKVILQQRYKKAKGKWKRVEVSSVLADGTFKLSDKPVTARKRWYRVVKPAHDGHRKGVSKKMKVSIEPWDGRIDVKLFWETGADLDLIVRDPSVPTMISADVPGPTPTGGVFNAASTTGCGGPGSYEQVTWPHEDAPTGRYYAYMRVGDPTLCDGDDAPEWRMEIRVNGKLVKSVRGAGDLYETYGFGEGATW